MTTNTESDTERGLDGEYVPSPLERIRKQVADYTRFGHRDVISTEKMTPNLRSYNGVSR
jgi:hypothetical protein